VLVRAHEDLPVRDRGGGEHSLAERVAGEDLAFRTGLDDHRLAGFVGEVDLPVAGHRRRGEGAAEALTPDALAGLGIDGGCNALFLTSNLAAGGRDALARSIDRWSRVLYVVAFAGVFLVALYA